MDLMQQTGTIRCALLEEGGDKWGALGLECQWYTHRKGIGGF